MRPGTASCLLVVSLLAGCSSKNTPAPADPKTERTAPGGALESAESFGAIGDRTRRSQALFTEMAKVLLHPRCVNCHPTDDRPRQGMAQEIHEPPVWRGPSGEGEPGAPCSGCHQAENSATIRVPGAPGWHLAPVEMGWLGVDAAGVCAQLKDNARNGGLTLEQVHEHVANDPLVAWGWSPGHDREPAPGTQAQFAALTRAWIDSGAACPDARGGTP
jgi:hypothetical protein